MRVLFNSIVLAVLSLSIVACGTMPNNRLAYQQDCQRQAGTYQDEGGPDWRPEDAECLVQTANGRIVEIEYGDDD